MTWKPLIEDEADRARLEALNREIVEAVAQHAGPRTDELVDQAILRAYLGADDGREDDLGSDALSAAITELGEHPSGPGLYGGAARIGWAVAHLTEGDDADTVLTAIEGSIVSLLEAKQWTYYDLISGLVGFGVLALERGDAGRGLAVRVLDELERTARPREPGLAWFTPPELLPVWQRELAGGGYWNLGLAHGVPGVVAVLARFVRAGIEPARARPLLEGATDWLIASAAPLARGRYCGWLPEGKPRDDHGGRPVAWCYGDLGVALAVWSAGEACERADWRDHALGLARGAASTPYAESTVKDAGLCHGAAGAAHCLNRLYQASGDPALGDAARAWIAQTVAERRDGAIAGFPAVQYEGGVYSYSPDASMLTGAVGVALALHAAVSDVEPSWDRLLLADLGTP